jgi:ketosteroid isomerase-like protein
MSQENVEVVRRAMGAFNRRDADDFAALCTQQVEIVPIRAAVEETIYQGPDAVDRFFGESDQTWERLSVEADELRDLGVTVLALGTLLARGRGSGADVEMQLGWVFEFEGGLIAAVRTYPSGKEALEAVGLAE